MLIYPIMELMNLLTWIQALIWTVSDRKYPRKIEAWLPPIYSEMKYALQEKFAHLLYEYLNALLESILIFYFTIYAYVEITDKEGHLGNLNMVFVTVAFGYQMLFSSKLTFRSENCSIFHFFYTVLKMAIFVLTTIGL